MESEESSPFIAVLILVFLDSGSSGNIFNSFCNSGDTVLILVFLDSGSSG